MAGKVVAFPPSGSITVRSNSSAFPLEGTSVVDPHGVVTGRVVRVFGPVARPYWSVRPRRPMSPAEAAASVGQEITTP